LLTNITAAEQVVMGRDGVDRLIGILENRGFTVMGPTVRDGAIVHGPLRSTGDLPVGLRDEHGPGTYRLFERGDDALFGYVVGPSSPKMNFHPAETVLWKGSTDLTRADPAPEPPRFAFIGVRACELAAIAIQDRVFLGSGAVDRTYAGNRSGSFIVAVNCVEPGATCFCASMDTGPRARTGYDLAMTEVIGDGVHHFVVEAGSDIGTEVLAALEARLATVDEIGTAERMVGEAAGKMGRSLDTVGIKELLYAAAEDPYWEEIAARCLTCANCTMVCPTCFCSTVEDRGELANGSAERVRKWDSCFNFEFSLVHGGPHRVSPASRYRQWMTHKLASWYDQFDTSGCVGCGRCITWCPVGIDITAEAAAFRVRGGDRA
jgi:ferredoxin